MYQSNQNRVNNIMADLQSQPRAPRRVVISRAQFDHALASVAARSDVFERALARINLLESIRTGCVEVVS
jgi:hypothetical protein